MFHVLPDLFHVLPDLYYKDMIKETPGKTNSRALYEVASLTYEMVIR